MVAEEEFEDLTDTRDPGWGFTVIIIIICVVINLSLPLWLRIGDFITGPCRQKEENYEEQAVGGTTPKHNPSILEGDDNEGGSVSVYSKNLARQEYNRIRRKKRDNHHNGDYASVVSSSVASTGTRFTDAASAVLDARPKRSRATPRKRMKRKVENRRLDVRMAAEYAAAEQAFNNFTCENFETAPPTPDDRSDAPRSVMSKLDADAISVLDAVDAADAGVVPVGKIKDTKSDSSGWKRMLEIADWDKEMKKFVYLAIPFSLQGVSAEFFDIVNVAIVGHFIGVREANAFVVVTILLEFTSTLTTGFSECIGVLIPHADGAGNDLLVGRYLQLGLIFYVIMSIPGVIMWAFLTEEAVLWFGFDEETASIGQAYAYTLLVTLFLEGIDECFSEFLNTLDHEFYATVFTIVASIIESIAIMVVALLGVKDLVVVGLVQVVLMALFVLVNLGIMMYKGWMDDYWDGIFRTNGLKDTRAVHTVFITAIPLGLAWLLTFGEWEVMTLFARHMGPDEVAAWGIIGYVWSAFETITDGFGDAAEVRVGFRMGAGQIGIAKMVGEKSVYFGVVVSIFETGLLFIIAEYLPFWLTPDPTMQKMLFDLLPLIGFGQILMVAGMEAWAVIGAQGRVRLATMVEFVISWFIAVPLSAMFVYIFNLNLEGMVAALTIAYTFGANVYLYILLKSDWEALSAIVVARNAAEGTMYEEFDWDDLPENIQEAAITLGYTKELWEKDQEPETNKKSWNQLTHEQQNAASLLGYNRKKWDGDSDTESSCNPKLPYDNHDWDELPEHVQKAAKCLGYSKNIWDNDGTSPLDSKSWKQLTSEQQVAAGVLGYNQQLWDDDDSSSSSSEAPTYDDCDWNELPKDVQKAAKCLGYSKKIWDSDGKSPADSKSWNQLTSNQQAAAGVLGYDQKKWDGDEADSQSSAPPSYDDCDWNELPKDVQKAAKCLGYSKKVWDSDGKLPIDSKNWNQLTPEQQAAAGVLGYDQKRWDGDGDQDSTHAVNNMPTHAKGSRTRSKSKLDVKPAGTDISDEKQESQNAVQSMFSIDSIDSLVSPSFPSIHSLQNEFSSIFGLGDTSHTSEAPQPCDYNDYDWAELPQKAQEAAIVLGYTEKLWDNDETAPSDDKYWDELSPEERQAATLLGYDRQKWDKDSDSSSV